MLLLKYLLYEDLSLEVTPVLCCCLSRYDAVFLSMLGPLLIHMLSPAHSPFCLQWQSRVLSSVVAFMSARERRTLLFTSKDLPCYGDPAQQETSRTSYGANTVRGTIRVKSIIVASQYTTSPNIVPPSPIHHHRPPPLNPTKN